MVTTVNIHCPRCGQGSQIFLSTRVSVIILHCPSCLSLLMYLRRRTFLLDRQTVKKNTGDSRALLVSRLLERIADADAAAIGALRRVDAAALRNSGFQQAMPHRTASGREERYITEDDCINLRIELALCADAKEFISQL